MRKLLVILFAVALIAGCKSEGGGDSDSGTQPVIGLPVSSDISFSTETSDSSADMHLAPEPGTLALFGIGLGALAAYRLKKRKKRN